MSDGANWPGDAHYPHEKLEGAIRALLVPHDLRAAIRSAVWEVGIAFTHGQRAWAKDLVERIHAMTHDPSIPPSGRGTLVDWAERASEEQMREVAHELLRLFERATEMNARQMAAAGVDPHY